MTPFKPISRPISADFFSIIEHGGEKCIHIHGYTYESSSNECVTADNPDGVYWANMEACGILLPLSKFLKEFKARSENGIEYVNQLYEQCKQYQGDYTSERIVEVINHYYRDIVFPALRSEGNPEAYLDFGEITEDTPCGQYLSYPNYEEIET